MERISPRSAGLLGVLVAGLAGCGSTAAPAASTAPASGSSAANAGRPSARASAPTFRLATGNTTPSTMYVWLAQDRGIFAKNGVNVESVGLSGQAQMQAVVAGEAEGTVHTGADLVFTTQAQGTDMKIVATGSQVDNDLLVAGNDIQSVEQLRGKKVGAQSLTAGNGQTTRRLMAKYGLQDGKDYTLVVTGSAGTSAGALAALVAHQVDAVAVPPALASPAIKQGQVHLLVDLAARSDLPIGSNVFALKTGYVQQHPDIVQKVVDSLIESVRLINQDKGAAEAELKTRFKLDDQAALDEEWQRQVEVLAKTPLPRKEDFGDVIAAMPKDIKPLTDAQLDAMLDPTFVNDAVKRGLTKF